MAPSAIIGFYKITSKNKSTVVGKARPPDRNILQEFPVRLYVDRRDKQKDRAEGDPLCELEGIADR
jgi:hypothetical protein